ncbi:MAG: cation diffusion facilitator family transporter, partial [Atribacterota bacterium]
ILVSDSLHTKSNLYVSISVFATLIAVKFGVTWLDMIAAVVIAGLIIRAGIQVLRQSSDVLCDRTPIKPDEIKEIVLSVPGIQDCHMIRTRGRLDDMYIDLHILVDENMPVEEAHELANTVEQHLKKEIPGVSDVVVHIEPENQHETEEDDDTLSLSN